MNLEDFSGLFALFTLVTAEKVFLLTFIFFYCVLALITLRQTQLMSRILDEADFSPFLKFLAAMHFLASVAVFAVALVLFMF